MRSCRHRQETREAHITAGNWASGQRGSSNGTGVVAMVIELPTLSLTGRAVLPMEGSVLASSQKNYTTHFPRQETSVIRSGGKRVWKGGDRWWLVW